jgi:hypothetical protein
MKFLKLPDRITIYFNLPNIVKGEILNANIKVFIFKMINKLQNERLNWCSVFL